MFQRYICDLNEGNDLAYPFVLVCNSRDAPMYFCERIYQAMALHPMDDKTLVRCIISRAEVVLYPFNIFDTHFSCM